MVSEQFQLVFSDFFFDSLTISSFLRSICEDPADSELRLKLRIVFSSLSVILVIRFHTSEDSDLDLTNGETRKKDEDSNHRL